MALKRSLKFVLDNGEQIVIDLTKAAKLNGTYIVMSVEQDKKGGYKLYYNTDVIPDFSKVVGIDIVRED